MKSIKKSILVLSMAIIFATIFSVYAFAGMYISSNVQNGDIWLYGDTPGVPVVIDDFDTPLDVGEVCLSQQVIADYGDGFFDVELKVQGGEGIEFVNEEAIVLVIDRSGSMIGNPWTQTVNACIALVESFPEEANIYFGIVTFETTATINSQLNNNRSEVISILKGLRSPSGSTYTDLGLQAAQNILSAYEGYGSKNVIVITDGQSSNPSRTSTAAANLKNSGALVYAIGVGSYRLSELQIIASSIPGRETIFTYSNFLLLSDTLTSILRNVTVNMGSAIDFENILSGNNHYYFENNKTLYWNLEDIDVNTLTYRVKLKESAIDKGFMPISSIASLRYTDINNQSRFESFDTPSVKMDSIYAVTFIDWDGAVIETQSVIRGDAAIAPTEPDNKYGWHFVGWDTDFSCITEDLTVTALYEINVYDVLFLDWDGVILGVEEVEHGAAATVPAEPEREGWIFAGWDVDFSCVTADLTVTAVYEPTICGVSVSASVEKLSGNKNNLTITVTEQWTDGSFRPITVTFSIDNNAAATYNVSPYRVYVDTKGNTQIRECYIVF